MMNKTFSSKITVDAHQSKEAELLSKVIKDNNVNEDGTFNTVTEFADGSAIDEGLNLAQDEDGDTYYFRGKVTDNYVKIGNLIESDDTGYYVSNNKGDTTSLAVSKIVFTPTENGTLSFDWRISSNTNSKGLVNPVAFEI